MPKRKSIGRGWHGDSKGHAEAGRKGGRVSSRAQKPEPQTITTGEGVVKDKPPPQE